MTSELEAIANAEGGGGATVIPVSVRASVRSATAAMPIERPRGRSLPVKKAPIPKNRIPVSTASANGSWSQRPSPAFSAPATGSSERWTSASSDQCENTAKGCSVDEKGCPQDEDGDGVCDALDKCPGTPAGAQVDAQGCETDASKLEGDLLDTGQLRVTGVTFQPGTANPAAGMSKLDPVGEVFTKWPELKVEIGVHTDPEGNTKPAALTKETQARADAVRAYLLQKYPQLKADQLVAKGYGTSRPLAANASEAGRTLNRRIEFTVLNKNVLVQSGGKRRLGTKP